MKLFRSGYGRWLGVLGGILVMVFSVGWLQLRQEPKLLRIGVFAGSN